jgi:hypothetical protein
MPSNDPVRRRVEDNARSVLAAFYGAARAGKELPECYLAAVEAWHRYCPGRSRSDAAHEAVALVLGVSYPDMAGPPRAVPGDER